jgi:predicted dehydrogenase
MTDLALVGAGDWGRNLLRVLDDETDATVPVCCHAGDPETRGWLVDNYPNVTVTTDYDDVLASDVDAVVIATPIPTHADLVCRALDAGTHVFCEKPLGPERAGAARAAELADHRDLTLFVGYLFVHHPLFARVSDIIATEGVRRVSLEWNYVGGFDTDLTRDLVSHPVSVTTALFGEGDAPGDPDDVTVAVREGVDGRVDRLDCTLTYREVPCDLRVSRLAPREAANRVTLVTDAGNCYVWDDTVLRRFDHGSESFERVAAAGTEPLAAECGAFLACLDAETVPKTDGGFAVAVQETLDAIDATPAGDPEH